MSVRHLGLNGHHRGTGQEAADGNGPVPSGGVFPDDLAIGIFQSELGVGHGLPRHRIHLRERQRTQGIVVKVELLGVVAGVYHHGLAAGVGVDGIAGGTGHLCADQGASDAGEDDLPLLIRCVQTVGGQLAISGVHHPAVRDRHILGGIIAGEVPFRGNPLIDGIVSGLQVREVDFPVHGGEAADGIAVGPDNLENGPVQQVQGSGVPLDNDQIAGPGFLLAATRFVSAAGFIPSTGLVTAV